MTREELDILQQIVPFVQRTETTLMIGIKEGIDISDIPVPDNFEKNLQTTLNDIKILNKKVMVMLRKIYEER